jgi:iron complex outermembrane receptor protein
MSRSAIESAPQAGRSRLSWCRALGMAVTCGSVLPAAAQSDLLDAPSDGSPSVLTATRLHQSQAEAPASITVVTAEMMQRYGIRSVVEAMRLVPGMEVSLADGNQYQVNYHGTNALNPRRINVMIDNISVYQVTIAEVRWDTLPVSVDDIERIEVVRGSDSAAYGPNSMMAVVNVITRHPADTEGLFAAADVGTNRGRRAMLRYGAKVGRSVFRLGVEHFENGGFSAPETPAQQYFSNDLSTNRLSLAATTAVDSETEVRTNAALWSASRGFSRVEPRELTPAPVQTHAGYLSSTIEHRLSVDHELSVRLYAAWNNQQQKWRTSYPEAALLPEMFSMWQANPTYANTILAGKRPQGGTPQDDALALAAMQAVAALGSAAGQPVDVTANQNYREQRVELEAQDSVAFSSDLRSVVGVGTRYNRGSSETYFGGAVDNQVFWAFGNLEYRPEEHVILNVGAYGESSRLAETAIAPRVALNVRLDSQQSLRFIASQGLRSPDIHEQRSNWTYTAHDASVPQFEGARLYQSAVSTTVLKDERIDSYEIGYFGLAPDYGVSLDAKAFYDHLYRLVSERLSLGTFDPTNGGHVDLGGAELQFNAEVSPRLSGFANYTYLYNSAPDDSTERTQYARHSGAVGASYRFEGDTRLSADYAFQSNNVVDGKHSGRLDINVVRTMVVGSTKVDLSASCRRLDSRDTVWLRGTTPITYSYPSRYQIFVGTRVQF